MLTAVHELGLVGRRFNEAVQSTPFLAPADGQDRYGYDAVLHRRCINGEPEPFSWLRRLMVPAARGEPGRSADDRSVMLRCVSREHGVGCLIPARRVALHGYDLYDGAIRCAECCQSCSHDCTGVNVLRPIWRTNGGSRHTSRHQQNRNDHADEGRPCERTAARATHCRQDSEFEHCSPCPVCWHG